MKWSRYSSEEMRHKEVDDAMSSWGDSYQVPPLKPPKKACILWSNSTPSPLELSQQFFGIKLLQVSRIVSTVSTQTWHVLCGASWLWA
jgi:hypothetical protein